RASEAVELAKKLGANEAWANISRDNGVSFEMRNGVLERVEESTSQGLSVQLWVDGRYSAHSTNDLRPASLESFVKEAVAITRSLQKDPFRVIPDSSLFANRPDVDLDLVDQSVSSVSREERLDLLKAMNDRIYGKDKVLSATSSVSTSHAHSAAASSNGFRGSYESTSMWIGAGVVLDEEGGKRPEEGYFGGGHHKAELPDPAETADMALELARNRLGSTKGPTKKTTMVVHPRAAGSIVGRLLGPLTGGALQQRRSFWADLLNKEASVSPKLSIVDDPLIVRGLGSRPFDGEGISAKRLPVIEKGVLKNYYVDTYYGKKLGMAPTTGSPSNRVMELGSKDLSGLIADLPEGILITSWLGGNSDGATGDFSLGVRGHLIEDGQIGAPVSEMNVTGNLLTLFQSLIAVGNDPWKYSPLKAPTLVFEEVNFSGA
nr:TldD/PmbA family protein [Pirellula sp.]